jgi:plasmid maintenance system antidote protein VapI
MGKKELNPVHPGEVLLKEFLKPMGLSQNRLALDFSRTGPGSFRRLSDDLT